MTCDLHERWQEGVRRQKEITAKLDNGFYAPEIAKDIRDLLDWIFDLREERRQYALSRRDA